MMTNGAVASPFSAGAVIGKRYRLREPLGEGTMGVVWLSADMSAEEDVALKLIVHPEPDARVHILHDAQASRAIAHENVARVLDVGETGSGDPYLVMELLSGETLAHMLARGRKLGQREVAAIGRDVARALAAGHGAGVVHRNLKPANVFLHDETSDIVPVVKVLDFGLGDDVVASSPGRDGGAGLVSSIYMSPEQLLGDEAIGGQSDIWSLGVMLYEMLTGASLFEGRAEDAVRKMWSADIPPVEHWLPRVDPSLSRLVMACLRRSPEGRPWPASEVAEALESVSGPPARMPLASLSKLSSRPPPSKDASNIVLPAPAQVPSLGIRSDEVRAPAASTAAAASTGAPAAERGPRSARSPAAAPAPADRTDPRMSAVPLEATRPTLPSAVAAPLPPRIAERPAGRLTRLRDRRWSPAAAAGAAAGACILSMIGVTAAIVFSAHGCSVAPVAHPVENARGPAAGR